METKNIIDKICKTKGKVTGLLRDNLQNKTLLGVQALHTGDEEYNRENLQNKG